MTTRQPGLRKRMQLEARRIFHQHEQLDALYAEVAKAVHAAEPGVPSPKTRDALARLREGLLAHFEMEEGTHFPALHGLSSENDERLVQLVQEHAGFRTELARIAGALKDAPVETVAADLDALARGLANHEKIEQQLFEAATKETS